MATIIAVRFREGGKSYYFDPLAFTPAVGDAVIVETAQGQEYGVVTMAPRTLPDGDLPQEIKPMVRPATPEDTARVQEYHEKERKAMATCRKKVEEHKLDMKLVTAQYSFDGGKLLIYFTADGRVDFRSLVKDLATTFHTRIELRQIGVRDEAKMLGGLGICGQPFCCVQYLSDFQSVSIKMAKEQGLSLNPAKISGSCGRLMCCLKHEQNAYEELSRITPRVGAVVQTDDGRGVVTEANLLTGMLKVRLDRYADSPPVALSREQAKVLRGRRSDEEDDPTASEET